MFVSTGQDSRISLLLGNLGSCFVNPANTGYAFLDNIFLMNFTGLR